MTPFFEQQALWDQISNPYRVKVGLFIGVIASRMGPSPGRWELAAHTAAQYAPWLTTIPTLRCPSDPSEGLRGQGRTNYAAYLGDSMSRLSPAARVSLAVGHQR